jgi:alpha-galactosidase
MKYGVVKTTVDLRRHALEKGLARVGRLARGEEQPTWKKSAEELVQVLRVVLCGGSTSCILNLPNRGQISNLPGEVVVETLATVNGKTVTAKTSGALPGAVGTLCRLHADVHELTVRAALEGSRDLLVQALSLDPLSGSADFCDLSSLADDLLYANRKWLPRFFPP